MTERSTISTGLTFLHYIGLTVDGGRKQHCLSPGIILKQTFYPSIKESLEFAKH